MKAEEVYIKVVFYFRHKIKSGEQLNSYWMSFNYFFFFPLFSNEVLT